RRRRELLFEIARGGLGLRETGRLVRDEARGAAEEPRLGRERLRRNEARLLALRIRRTARGRRLRFACDLELLVEVVRFALGRLARRREALLLVEPLRERVPRLGLFLRRAR